ncbi:MAG: hypothetical protein ACREP9_17770 [Candidatus Dormibacteraceae bacterium]
MLVVWGALIVVGFVGKGLLWLSVLAFVPFLITGGLAALTPVSPSPRIHSPARPVSRFQRESHQQPGLQRRGAHRAAHAFPYLSEMAHLLH